MASGLHELLRASAARTPDTPALVLKAATLSFAELDMRSEQLARYLAASGCRRGDRIALLSDKSADTYIGLWAILKAGCAYVPFDRRAPVDRLSYIADNCEIAAIVASPATSKLADQLLDAISTTVHTAVVVADAGTELEPKPGYPAITGVDLPADLDADDIAYILYTSGSTGRPKGVTISHVTALSWAEWSADHINLQPGEHVSGHAPLHFDLSTFDTFAAAKAGSSLYPVPDGTSTFPSRLNSWIRENGISVLYCVPSALSLMARDKSFDDSSFPDLRAIIFAGEVFPLRYLNVWLDKVPHADFVNWYGPTETNVCTTYTVDRSKTYEQPVPIGHATGNADLYVIDAEGNVIDNPLGVEGELCASGACVANGYWGDPEKTDAVFSCKDGSRHYRTGDLVVLDANGDYTYVGRRDHMIKSRGYRIELGEIEAALYKNSEVKEAVVIPVPDDVLGNRLIACIATEGDAGAKDVLAVVAQTVPKYMVPERVIVKPELPKTSTGKFDRQALAAECEQQT